MGSLLDLWVLEGLASDTPFENWLRLVEFVRPVHELGAMSSENCRGAQERAKNGKELHLAID
jgi:hypothetical protein